MRKNYKKKGGKGNILVEKNDRTISDISMEKYTTVEIRKITDSQIKKSIDYLIKYYIDEKCLSDIFKKSYKLLFNSYKNYKPKISYRTKQITGGDSILLDDISNLSSRNPLYNQLTNYCEYCKNRNIDDDEDIKQFISGDPSYIADNNNYNILNNFITNNSSEYYLYDLKCNFTPNKYNYDDLTIDNHSSYNIDKTIISYEYNKNIVTSFEYNQLIENNITELQKFLNEQINYLDNLSKEEKKIIQDYTNEKSYNFYKKYKNYISNPSSPDNDPNWFIIADDEDFGDAFYPQIHKCFEYNFIDKSKFSNDFINNFNKKNYNTWVNTSRIDNRNFKNEYINFTLIDWIQILSLFTNDLNNIIINAPYVKFPIYCYRGTSSHFYNTSLNNSIVNNVKLQDNSKYNIKECNTFKYDAITSFSLLYDVSKKFYNNLTDIANGSIYRVIIHAYSRVLYISPLSAFPYEYEIIAPLGSIFMYDNDNINSESNYTIKPIKKYNYYNKQYAINFLNPLDKDTFNSYDVILIATPQPQLNQNYIRSDDIKFFEEDEIENENEIMKNYFNEDISNDYNKTYNNMFDFGIMSNIKSDYQINYEKNIKKIITDVKKECKRFGKKTEKEIFIKKKQSLISRINEYKDNEGLKNDFIYSIEKYGYNTIEELDNVELSFFNKIIENLKNTIEFGENEIRRLNKNKNKNSNIEKINQHIENINQKISSLHNYIIYNFSIIYNSITQNITNDDIINDDSTYKKRVIDTITEINNSIIRIKPNDFLNDDINNIIINKFKKIKTFENDFNTKLILYKKNYQYYNDNYNKNLFTIINHIVNKVVNNNDNDFITINNLMVNIVNNLSELLNFFNNNIKYHIGLPFNFINNNFIFYTIHPLITKNYYYYYYYR